MKDGTTRSKGGNGLGYISGPYRLAAAAQIWRQSCGFWDRDMFYICTLGYAGRRRDAGVQKPHPATRPRYTHGRLQQLSGKRLPHSFLLRTLGLSNSSWLQASFVCLITRECVSVT